jgi:hypothetical protein
MGILFGGEPTCPRCGHVGALIVSYSHFALAVCGDGSADVASTSSPRIRCDMGCDLSGTPMADEIESALQERWERLVVITFDTSCSTPEPHLSRELT